jgi:rhomboid protease GluP
MSSPQTPTDDQTAEIIQPVASDVPTEGYSPAQARRRRDYSVWDPRSAPGTYVLMALNIAVYLWMCLNGVDPRTPSVPSLLHYGSNQTWLVLHGEWYRLLTAIFVHVGLLHLAGNMWCLWNLGILGEPLIGPYGMIAVYMLTGIAGNLLSMGTNILMDSLKHTNYFEFIPGAGASGAVFGIAGMLIILLSNRRLPFPWVELQRLRSSVIKFAAINLVIGLTTIIPIFGISIDNAAHIGGFLSGMALGVPLVPRMTAGRDRYFARQKVSFAAACVVLALVGYFIARFA